MGCHDDQVAPVVASTIYNSFCWMLIFGVNDLARYAFFYCVLCGLAEDPLGHLRSSFVVLFDRKPD